MGIVNKDDILALRIEQEVICSDCVTDEEWKDFKEEDIITGVGAESADELIFCDRCKNKLNLKKSPSPSGKKTEALSRPRHHNQREVRRIHFKETGLPKQGERG